MFNPYAARRKPSPRLDFKNALCSAFSNFLVFFQPGGAVTNESSFDIPLGLHEVDQSPIAWDQM